jgi:RimJ/RimL family protein N-acetyltransferase
MVEYRQFIRKLDLPSGFTAPSHLVYEDLRANAITRADLREDVRGINASIELIRRTRGGRWPTEEVTEDFNFVDLVWHECEFREGDSFAYVLSDADGRYLGCCYLYPMGRRAELTEALLQHDVDVSWWVTPEAYERGFYAKAYSALRQWVTRDYPFSNPHFSNREIPS